MVRPGRGILSGPGIVVLRRGPGHFGCVTSRRRGLDGGFVFRALNHLKPPVTTPFSVRAPDLCSSVFGSRARSSFRPISSDDRFPYCPCCRFCAVRQELPGPSKRSGRDRSRPLVNRSGTKTPGLTRIWYSGISPCIPRRTSAARRACASDRSPRSRPSCRRFCRSTSPRCTRLLRAARSRSRW